MITLTNRMDNMAPFTPQTEVLNPLDLWSRVVDYVGSEDPSKLTRIIDKLHPDSKPGIRDQLSSAINLQRTELKSLSELTKLIDEAIKDPINPNSSLICYDEHIVSLWKIDPTLLEIPERQIEPLLNQLIYEINDLQSRYFRLYYANLTALKSTMIDEGKVIARITAKVPSISVKVKSLLQVARIQQTADVVVTKMNSESGGDLHCWLMFPSTGKDPDDYAFKEVDLPAARLQFIKEEEVAYWPMNDSPWLLKASQKKWSQYLPRMRTIADGPFESAVKTTLLKKKLASAIARTKIISL